MKLHWTDGFYSGFVFDPRLHELQLPLLSFSTLYSSSLWRADTTIFTKLNKPSLSNTRPVSIILP